MTDHDRKPAELERDAERARAEVSATIDAIQNKLTPGQLMDQAVSYLRTSLPAEFGHNLADTVRTNPVPVALVGVGLAWLAFSGRNGARSGVRSDRFRDDLGEPWEFAGGRSLDGGSNEEDRSLSERVGEAADRAKDNVGEVQRDARDIARRARDSMHHASERSRESYERARAKVSELRSSAADYIQDQPLVLGGLGIALGAALGASLPRTETEDELMGESRDDLMKTAADKARDFANQAGDDARQKIREEAS